MKQVVVGQPQFPKAGIGNPIHRGMLLTIRMVFRFLTLCVFLTAIAFSQSADITGWSDLRWGTTKPIALKLLQPLSAHECNRTNNVSCAEEAGADVLVVEKFNFNKIPFTVNLLFTPKGGLSKATMTAEDNVADYAPTQVLAEAFRGSGYDGIMYRSTLGQGVNVAVFDPALARVVSRFMFDVSSVQFGFSPIPTPPEKPKRKR